MRRQFSSQIGSKEERKVIDYQTTSFTAAKLIARGLTMTQVGNYVNFAYEEMIKEVKQGVFTNMDVLHHLLSGFKALFTAQGMLDVEEARRMTGGAGYQSSSGFTTLFAQISPMPTYEGENTVMMGQAARYLFKLIKKV